jgi:hypothetical protein
MLSLLVYGGALYSAQHHQGLAQAHTMPAAIPLHRQRKMVI